MSDLNDDAPGPDLSKQIVSGANEQELEKCRQIALETMESISRGCHVVPDSYQDWSRFVDDIEAEQARRDPDAKKSPAG